MKAVILKILLSIAWSKKIYEVRRLFKDMEEQEKTNLLCTSICDREEKFGPSLYGLKPVVFKRGKGVKLYDIDGNEYLDFATGHGVGNIGHCHPKIVKAIQKQAEELMILHASFPHESRARLYELLCDITPKSLNCSFLSNSGTESVEAAIKLAMANHRDVKNPKIIAFRRGFHGRSLGSLALTHGRKYRQAFEDRLAAVEFASFNKLESVEELIDENTIAIMMELVQGEGGVYPADPEFPGQIRELCDEKDLSLIFDEVQTGFGRTGRMFCLEHYRVAPDILCVAKSMAGGVPIGATIASEDYFQKLEKGEHASTFGGNPLACAAAVAVIETIIEENLVVNADNMGKIIENHAEKWVAENKMVKAHRGLGLMRGIHFRGKAGKYLKYCFENNLIALNAGTSVLRMLPPLVIQEDELLRGLKIIESSL